ncbi:MAG: FHA domain-containing protein [Eubacterium sp.]|nr:FHA domain-containing protein [Eubacterium sp.]
MNDIMNTMKKGMIDGWNDTMAESMAPDLMESVMESVDETTLPIYLLLIYGEEESFVVNAFYVEDTNGTGNGYLLTDGIVSTMADAGYEIYIACQGFVEEVDGYYFDENNAITYLQTDAMTGIRPFEMSEQMDGKDPFLAYLTMTEAENFEYMAYQLDLSTWETSGSLYFSDSQIGGLEWLGAPVFDSETCDVVGLMHADDGYNAVIADITHMDFVEEQALVTGSGGATANTTTDGDSQSEGEAEGQTQVQSENPSGTTTTGIGTASGGTTSGSHGGMQGSAVGILVIIVIAIVAVYFYKKKKGSTKPPADAAEIPYQGTVMLEETAADETEETYVNEQTQMEQKTGSYQVRSISGSFAGQIFILDGHMKIGRNSQCAIAYSDQTKGISGFHCEIYEYESGIVLRDLQSTYGTFVEMGGKKTKLQPALEYFLQPGDVFYLADEQQSFRVERAGESRAILAPAVKAIVSPKPGEIYRADMDRRILFGRSEYAQVRFPEDAKAISTKHCVLYRTNEGLFLMDTGSTNGTFFREDQRLRANVPYPVKKGMSFFLSSPNYTFVITEDE